MKKVKMLQYMGGVDEERTVGSIQNLNDNEADRIVDAGFATYESGYSKSDSKKVAPKPKKSIPIKRKARKKRKK